MITIDTIRNPVLIPVLHIRSVQCLALSALEYPLDTSQPLAFEWARIAPLLYWWGLKGIILKFSLLLFLFTTHLNEQDNDDGSHEDEDDRDEYDFEKEFHETHSD